MIYISCSTASCSLATLIIMSINVNAITKKHTRVHFKGNVGISSITFANVCVDKFELMSQWKAYSYYHYYFKILNIMKSPTELLGK